MQCYVYKGDKKEDHYLYLNQDISDKPLPDDFPQAILDLMGDLSFVIDFELDASKKLAQADAEHVLENMQNHGFYLQMPKKDMDALEDAYFS